MGHANGGRDQFTGVLLCTRLSAPLEHLEVGRQFTAVTRWYIVAHKQELDARALPQACDFVGRGPAKNQGAEMPLFSDLMFVSLGFFSINRRKTVSERRG